eukprot:TRINITY_DN5039_c0_g2_i3.p1 TRINITY_DN5039_c0_g2~~TRINITY_DN5039_c0_g2_i3.p1  ORF type:complete len:151 (+),score=40.47 TRINITY_DN5039_c0_g2_i3:79-531(+)
MKDNLPTLSSDTKRFYETIFNAREEFEAVEERSEELLGALDKITKRRHDLLYEGDRTEDIPPKSYNKDYYQDYSVLSPSEVISHRIPHKLQTRFNHFSKYPGSVVEIYLDIKPECEGDMIASSEYDSGLEKAQFYSFQEPEEGECIHERG